MKALAFAFALAASVTIGIASPPAAESPDPTECLLRQYEKERSALLYRLNQRYIKQFEVRRNEAMQAGDLPGANAADRSLKKLLAQQREFEAERKKMQLIASLAGDWKLTTSGWAFKVAADGSVTAGDPVSERGRIEVLDLDKRTVRMTGFPMTLTWVVEEEARRLLGNQHPAERIDALPELEQLLKDATKAGAPGPRSAMELADYLHGTTWNISNRIADGDVVYTMTFNKNGTFKQSDGRIGKLEFLGARKFRLWNYDPATLDDNLKQFRAVGSATVYFGNLKSR